MDKGREQCSVCLELLGENLMAAVCGHVFHHDCIKSWVQTNPTCPLCKRGTSYNNLIRLKMQPAKVLRVLSEQLTQNWEQPHIKQLRVGCSGLARFQQSMKTEAVDVARQGVLEAQKEVSSLELEVALQQSAVTELDEKVKFWKDEASLAEELAERMAQGRSQHESRSELKSREVEFQAKVLAARFLSCVVTPSWPASCGLGEAGNRQGQASSPASYGLGEAGNRQGQGSGEAAATTDIFGVERGDGAAGRGKEQGRGGGAEEGVATQPAAEQQQTQTSDTQQSPQAVNAASFSSYYCSSSTSPETRASLLQHHRKALLQDPLAMALVQRWVKEHTARLQLEVSRRRKATEQDRVAAQRVLSASVTKLGKMANRLGHLAQLNFQLAQRISRAGPVRKRNIHASHVSGPAPQHHSAIVAHSAPSVSCGTATDSSPSASLQESAQLHQAAAKRTGSGWLVRPAEKQDDWANLTTRPEVANIPDAEDSANFKRPEPALKRRRVAQQQQKQLTQNLLNVSSSPFSSSSSTSSPPLSPSSCSLSSSSSPTISSLSVPSEFELAE
eukprot:gb/GEZN01005345.1/.p1 GENE.gb/GEZN01005345.1/~~gb/GEZN01005345.1/.p1  ORF type:complete len:559 (+),score=131.98 gb/GEZN01005345.1/:26-1702(+)